MSVLSKEKLEINFKFYLFLKEINSQKSSDKIIIKWLQSYSDGRGTCKDFLSFLSVFKKDVTSIKNDETKTILEYLLSQIKNEDDLKIFIFSLKLLQAKPLLLAEAKLAVSSNAISSRKDVHPLSLAADRVGKDRAYYIRVNGALISLLFFTHLEKKNNIYLSGSTEDFFNGLVSDYEVVKKIGIDPNEIFMLMFSECINQSITSSAGASYEDRIFSLLLSIGLKENEISKIHDKKDASTEYDFFFAWDSKTYGISAKRTLRERYKQFIKTAHTSKIDVMMEITLGIDLTEDKANIIRKHDVYLFVADEIYEARDFLQKIEGVYPASAFSLELLEQLK